LQHHRSSKEDDNDFAAGGKSLLMLLPSEKEAMLKQLEDAKVPLKPLKINPSKTQPVSPALQALLSKNNDLKASHVSLWLSRDVLTQQHLISLLSHFLTSWKHFSCMPCLVMYDAASCMRD